MASSAQPKLLIVSDNAVPTGFGRIADEIAIRLARRGWNFTAASFFYDGLLPAGFKGFPLPYHVAPLQNRPDWSLLVKSLIEGANIDIVLVIQDAPYAVELRNQSIDWSSTKFCAIAPVDGYPLDPGWVDVMRTADGAMTISEFGVRSFAREGVEVGLCRPAIDLNEFRPADSPAHREELRTRLGLTNDHFLLGTMCQNQGRKLIPLMLEAFFTFAEGKPLARYLLDTTTVGQYHIPNLVRQQKWDESKLIYVEQAVAALPELADRYRALDAMQVVSSREGFGLPLVEAMASGVVSIALDYTSGPEIVGEGRGVLLPCADTTNISTWGGALDHYPDMKQWVGLLNKLYAKPGWRASLSETGLVAARAHTWDHATDAVESTLVSAYYN